MQVPSNTMDIAKELQVPEFLVNIPVRNSYGHITSLEELFLKRNEIPDNEDIYREYTDEIESIRSTFNFLSADEITEIHDITRYNNNTTFHPDEKKLLQEYLKNERQKIILEIKNNGKKFKKGELSGKFVDGKYEGIINEDIVKRMDLNYGHGDALKTSLTLQSFKKILKITDNVKKNKKVI